MSYELLVLPVPPGAAVEEAGEALEVRVSGGHVFVDTSPDGDSRRRALAAVVAEADPLLRPNEDAPEGRIVLSGEGVGVRIDAAFVVCRVSYAHAGEDGGDAERLFERLFGVIRAVVGATGWRVYDPQGTSAVEAGDEGRSATLEIYLSVIDQLRPR